MSCRFVVPTIVLAASMFSLPARAQNAPRTPFPAPDPGALPVDRSQEKHIDGWYRDVPVPPKDQKAAPAPRHDLSGIWEPAAGWRDGVQFLGAKEYPSDGKHILPFTPLGEKAFKANKPGFGTTEVPIALNNDPFDICDPIGFPRIELFNLRAIQVVQTEKQVLIFYQNDRTFRSIWMDGREFPPRIFQSHDGTATRPASGRTIPHSSSRRSGSMKEPGSIMSAVRIAATCEWKSGSTA